MIERGMIFNGEMVRAILDGRKTQTRRIMAPQPADDIERSAFPNPDAIGWKSSLKHKYGSTTAHFCPFGAIGDRIWVRETFRVHSRATDVATLVYKASERNSWTEQTHRVPVAVCNKPATPEKWTPSLHMPRWASRILLEITDVRVERINSISQEDAQAEGLELTGWRPTYSDPDSGGEVMTPYDNFAELWSSIYGDESWQANPWVWVIEFKRVEGGAA
ncbi:hypothetical protein [Raoultella ornithinolytica]|uniref:hypothetical protein n=1 Tax=Raoultella ornithinolytica TaxID=54291 RepID=UPI001F26CC93|nr:hypothetical protein [Raoultella ornithinolytica]MCF6686166.1 hypothetical protein [Raoultella ornithinolytica]HAV2259367.1 hypothetical protein [Raoultella ornithinolytica]